MRSSVLVSRPPLRADPPESRAGSPPPLALPLDSGGFRASIVHSHGRTIGTEWRILASSGKSRKSPEPTRSPRRVASHPDARAACSAPRVLVPARGRGSCLALSVGSLAWSLRYFLRPSCSPPSESLRLPSPTSQPKRLETKNVVSIPKPLAHQ